MQISKEMIEAAAMAIQATFSNKSGFGKDWSQVPRSLRQSYRQEAKAALQAALRTSESV